MGTIEEMLSRLHMSNRSAMVDDMTYVLGIEVSKSTAGQSSQVVAALCSNKSIRLYNRETMNFLQEYKEGTGVICGARFAHKNHNLLYSASSDGTVKSWDIRAPGASAVQIFKGYPSNAFISFDISCSDLVVCAGTEKIEEEDAFLVFWDTRSPEGMPANKDPLGVYSESHNDDVTQIRFHPTNPSKVASGSTDGLVNIFDIKKDTEDDALIATCNSDSSVSFLGWAGEDHNQIYCLTHDEGFCWWDLAQIDTEDAITLSKITDMRPQVQGCAIDYLIGGMYHEKENSLFLAGGSHAGDIHILSCKSDKVRHLKTLSCGHSSTVRSFHWNLEDGSLLTGGEDAQLLLWSPDTKEIQTKNKTLKMASTVQQRVRVHNTKSYSPKQK
ncbi:WD repeat-containing protein 89 [Pelobates fuscus]|uniref:WD repeat-containing protein 89 n=1 Tax=Pelobates fuscus TaxID=191477 RepID=UPI002FE45A6A